MEDPTHRAANMSLKVTRSLGQTFGAEVSGIRIGPHAGHDDVQAVKALWAEHKLLLFRAQEVSEADLVGFSRHLGELEIHVRTEYLSPEHPEILYVSNMRSGDRNIGILADSEVGWHYDQIYLPQPATGSLLCADVLPERGGDTYFADMNAAFVTLPPEVRQRLEGRKAVQSYEAFNRTYSVPTSEEQKKRSPDIEHPMVRTHPVTGEPALYICPGMTTRIVGMEPSESEEMLDYLFEWSVRPEFVYRHQWQPGDCLLWDNACTMHRREPFDPAQKRLMKRTTILPPTELARPF